VIRFFFLEEKSSTLIATIKNWFNEFQRGRTSVFAQPRPGARKTATMEDNLTNIQDLVLTDRRLKVCKIAGISKDRVDHMVLDEISGMRKLSARWEPRLLTPDNKRNYYAELMGRFDTEFQKKWPHLAKKKVLFHHENALA